MASGGAKKTIRQLRQERGWSQLDLALRLRVALSTVRTWEGGQAIPLDGNRQRVADLFGISVGEIAFGLAEHHPPAGTGQERP